jgi:hypothetical protein
MEKPRVCLKNSADVSTLATKITGTARVSRGVGDIALVCAGSLATATFNAAQFV